MKIFVNMSNRYYPFWETVCTFDYEDGFTGETRRESFDKAQSLVVLKLIDRFIVNKNPVWFGRFNEGDLDGNKGSENMKKICLELPKKTVTSFKKKCKRLNMDYKFVILDMMNRESYRFYYNRKRMNELDLESRNQISSDYRSICKDDYLYTVLDIDLLQIVKEYSKLTDISITEVISKSVYELIEYEFRVDKVKHKRVKRTVSIPARNSYRKDKKKAVCLSIKVSKPFLKYIRYYTRNCGVSVSAFSRYAIERMIKNDIIDGKVELSEKCSMYFKLDNKRVRHSKGQYKYTETSWPYFR